MMIKREKAFVYVFIADEETIRLKFSENWLKYKEINKFHYPEERKGAIKIRYNLLNYAQKIIEEIGIKYIIPVSHKIILETRTDEEQLAYEEKEIRNRNVCIVSKAKGAL